MSLLDTHKAVCTHLFKKLTCRLMEELMWASLVAQTVKNLPAVQETGVQSLGWENPLDKELIIYFRSSREGENMTFNYMQHSQVRRQYCLSHASEGTMDLTHVDGQCSFRV